MTLEYRVKSSDGQSITIGDIAKVQEGKAPRFGSISIDGKEAVLGMVLQRSATNAAKVVERVKARIATVNSALYRRVLAYIRFMTEQK